MPKLVYSKDDLRDFVNHLELIPSGEDLNWVSDKVAVPFTVKRAGHFSTPDATQVNVEKGSVLAYECELQGNHQDHVVLYVKAYNHITKVLQYVTSVEFYWKELKPITYAQLLKEILSSQVKIALSVQEATHAKLFEILGKGSVRVLENERTFDLADGSIICVAHESVTVDDLLEVGKSSPMYPKLPRYQYSMGTFYRSLLDNKDFADVILKVEGRQIYVISHIFAAASPYFRSVFKGEFAETLKTVKEGEKEFLLLELTDFTYGAVFVCAEWIYSGQITSLFEVESDTLKSSGIFGVFRNVYLAADYFGLSNLSSEILLRMPFILDNTNFGDVFAFAVDHNKNSLVQEAVKTMKKVGTFRQSDSGSKSKKVESKPSHENGEQANATDTIVEQQQVEKVFEALQGSLKIFRLYSDVLASTDSKRRIH